MCIFESIEGLRRHKLIAYVRLQLKKQKQSSAPLPCDFLFYLLWLVDGLTVTIRGIVVRFGADVLVRSLPQWQSRGASVLLVEAVIHWLGPFCRGV